MEITMDESQLEDLLTLVESGRWFINGHRRDPLEQFDDLMQVIYAQAVEAGLDNLVEYADDFEEYFPTRELEERALDFMEEYDKNTFWERLISRLAKREMVDDLGPDQVKEMESMEYAETLHEYEEQYYEVFQEKGLEAIQVER